MYDHDFTKEQFKAFWPGGYYENFNGIGYTPKVFTDVFAVLEPLMNKEHTALELGPGRGRWTRLLTGAFKHVIAGDVIPRSNGLTGPEFANLTYIELKEHDFYCTGVADSSIDFAFSYGMFCHLSADACAT